MAAPDASHRLDHIVVLMFENRSFDHLLGTLYTPQEKPGFEGILGRSLSNPIPAGADGAERGTVPLHPATDLDTPDPDPGEEYPHVNTQLFGTVDPTSNAGVDLDEIRAPFNAPAPGAAPTMQGFVRDYIGAYRAEMGRAPTYDEYARIMAYYTRDQLPVLTTLARGFATFDHWFCEVPSQTYPNRSFFHAASSSGFVVNGPPGKFGTFNVAETIFERLEAAHRSWMVYIDRTQLLPATALIHASRLTKYFPTNFSGMDDFYASARDGTLPDYAFIEPNMLHPHTDLHPPGAARLRRTLRLPAPDAMTGGERLLANVYDAIRTSASPGGSNWANTLLLVTFDEHGGIYDHVPPPAAPPPVASAPAGEMGFRFDRSGVRIPTIAISAWVEAGTVVSQEFRSTSMIRTLRERWALGPPLTNRDAAAPDIAPVLTRTAPRPPGDWPRVVAPPPGRFDAALEWLERPMELFERQLIAEAVALERGGLAVDVRTMSHHEAHRHAHRIGPKMFPRVGGHKRPVRVEDHRGGVGG